MPGFASLPYELLHVITRDEHGDFDTRSFAGLVGANKWLNNLFTPQMYREVNFERKHYPEDAHQGFFDVRDFPLFAATVLLNPERAAQVESLRIDDVDDVCVCLKGRGPHRCTITAGCNRSYRGWPDWLRGDEARWRYVQTRVRQLLKGTEHLTGFRLMREDFLLHQRLDCVAAFTIAFLPNLRALSISESPTTAGKFDDVRPSRSDKISWELYDVTNKVTDYYEFTKSALAGYLANLVSVFQSCPDNSDYQPGFRAIEYIQLGASLLSFGLSPKKRLHPILQIAPLKLLRGEALSTTHFDGTYIPYHMLDLCGTLKVTTLQLSYTVDLWEADVANIIDLFPNLENFYYCGFSCGFNRKISTDGLLRYLQLKSATLKLISITHQRFMTSFMSDPQVTDEDVQPMMFKSFTNLETLELAQPFVFGQKALQFDIENERMYGVVETDDEDMISTQYQLVDMLPVSIRDLKLVLCGDSDAARRLNRALVKLLKVRDTKFPNLKRIRFTLNETIFRSRHSQKTPAADTDNVYFESRTSAEHLRILSETAAMDFSMMDYVDHKGTRACSLEDSVKNFFREMKIALALAEQREVRVFLETDDAVIAAVARGFCSVVNLVDRSEWRLSNLTRISS